MSHCLVMCLAISFLQNSLQHVQVLGNTDVLLVCFENLSGMALRSGLVSAVVAGVNCNVLITIRRLDKALIHFIEPMHM